MSVGRHVVICVGNEYRGDDAVGLEVARELEGRVPEGVRVVSTEQEPSRLIDAWNGADTAVVVDAVESGAEPGTVHRFDATAVPLPARVFRSSTHAFGVGDAIEISRALGSLPRRVLVYGVEGRSFVAGDGLSPKVASAVALAAGRILDDMSLLTREEETSCTNAH